MASDVPLNCFSIDVEGFIESNLESVPSAASFRVLEKENYEIETNVDAALELLDEAGVHGTFFVVGRISHDIPQVVRRIADAGHEIGCHSYEHLRVFRLERNEFRAKLAVGKRNLEDVSGKEVVGFRAPDFSITQSSVWALDVLAELGFLYDSSIYPIGLHDVYGIHDAPARIHVLPNGLVEWPLSTFEVLGVRFPFGGGGYFRLYPLVITAYQFSRWNRSGQSCMFYLHPYEIGPIIPNIPMSPYRRFRHCYNCDAGTPRLKRLLKEFRFGPALDILSDMGFLQAKGIL
jgi:polysaccharide deacetylase family protein (PEP-CTERM system associated)